MLFMEQKVPSAQEAALLEGGEAQSNRGGVVGKEVKNTKGKSWSDLQVTVTTLILLQIRCKATEEI